jgi:hypothetical protein
MLSLVLIVVIVANVVLWSYQMNQLDWEKMREDISIVDVAHATATANQTLYAHQETITIGGTSYYFLKLDSGDSAGTNFDTDSAVGRYLLFRAVYPLTGVDSIPASRWTFYYRVQRFRTALGAVTLPVCHADVDILIRRSDGTIRTTIATATANSPDFTASLDVWETVGGTHSWSSYAVVNQTDYLEIAFYIQLTSAGTRAAARMRIDDINLDLTNQTRVTGIAFKVVIGGTLFTFKNKSPLTSRLVSLWVINSTHHLRHDIDVFINSGETLPYFRVDISLPAGEWVVKVVTERGNIATYQENTM